MRRFVAYRVRPIVLLIVTLSIFVAPLATPAAAQDIDGIINLAHLEFLHDIVEELPEQEGHETIDPEEPLDAWWTYADRREGDVYERVGGGAYDPATNTWGQGAYNLDDVARAAIVYMNHYRYYGDQLSYDRGYGALRHVLYMQTLTGENAGNFVIWMQPDGTLNPTPTPPDDPNPADAGFSWWAARAMWALAEGYHTYRDTEPELIQVIEERMALAMDALDRQVLAPNDGQYIDLHGYLIPAWFIGDGADASSIALIGLTRYFQATGDGTAERLARQLAEGIEQFQLGDPVTWAFQAHLPWAGSISNWHAWGVRMVKSLALAGETFGEHRWIVSADQEANQFLTHELVSIGPINGLLPAPNDLVQINYGNEVLTTNLLALADATGKQAYSILAGLQATWWFGNNPAGEPMYDPATGRGYDGIEPDGRINRNSGAESVISALLGLMEVLQNPVASEYLRYDEIVEIVGWTKYEAEAGDLSGGAEAVVADPAWTGEALWSGGAYVALERGERVSIPVTAEVTGRYRLFIVYDKQLGPAHEVAVEVRVNGARPLPHFQGGADDPGASPNDSYLWMDSIAFPGVLQAGDHTITIRGLRGEARIDAILLQPIIEYRMLGDGEGNTVTLLKSLSGLPDAGRLPLRGESVVIRTFSSNGRLLSERSHTVRGPELLVPVPRYGYAVVEASPN